MATRSASQVFTGLTDEPFFISCRKKLRAKGSGAQALKIVNVDKMRLEREDDSRLWTTVLDTEDFTLGIVDDGSFEDGMIRGVAGGVVLDEYPDSNFDQHFSHATIDARAQAVRLGAAARITRAEFSMFQQNGPTGSLYARLYAASGTFGSSAVPTGAALAESAAVDVTTLPGAYDMIPFDFATPPRIEADTTYCIAVEFDGTPAGATGYPLVGGDVFSATHAGNISSRNRSTGLWSATPSQDLIFRLTGFKVPPPSDRYMLVAECTLAYLPGFGSGQTKMDFRRPARVVASARNPVVAGIS
jgi:hypothetical protein